MMRPNQGFRSLEMIARTSKTGANLTISSKRGSVTLDEFEVDRLCRWLIGLLEIDVALEEAALGRVIRMSERLMDAMRRMFDIRADAAAISAEAARIALAQPKPVEPPPKRKRTVRKAKRKAKAHK